MNKFFKIIYNRHTDQMVVTSELAKGTKKSLTGKILVHAVSVIPLLGSTDVFADTISVTKDNQVINTYQNGALIIDFSDPNLTLIFKDIVNNDYGSAINANSGITLLVQGKNDLSGGNLIFQNNQTSSMDGGAIFTSVGTIDLSKLNSITFEGNIASNNGAGRGGGIYSYSSSASSVILGNNATFNSNIAGTNGLGNGGGIYSYSSLPSNVILGNNASFTHNIAGRVGGSGGGIYSLSAATTGPFSTVEMGDNAVFIGNMAGLASYGYGGAIFSSSISLGRGAYFSGNRTGNNDSTIYSNLGGAIYSRHNISLKGNSYFTGNLVNKSSKATGLGGAIYLLGYDSSNNAIFNTDDGAIAFKDNFINVTKDNTSSATTNALYLNKNILMTIDGNNPIFFDDAITSSSNGNNSLVKNGNSFIQFVGANRLNTTNYGDANSVNIENGILRVVKGASFDTSGGGIFYVAQGGSLAGGGTVKAASGGFSISGVLSADSDRFEVPKYNIVNHQFANWRDMIAINNRIGTLILNGIVKFDNAIINIDLADNASDKVEIKGSASGTINSVDLQSWSNVAGKKIISATSGNLNNLIPTTTTFLGQNLPIIGRTMTANYAGSTNNQLNLTTFSDDNKTLYWRDTSGSWNMDNASWNENQDTSSVKSNFIAGDTVIFDGQGEQNISLSGGGQQVSGMQISAGNYTLVEQIVIRHYMVLIRLKI